MSALNSLLKKLEPLHIYNITENSNIYRELQVYAAALDLFSEDVDTLLSEGFYVTAESFGLESMEKLWGKARDDLSLERRREMICLRNAFGLNDFTLAGINKLVSFLGLDNAQVEEYPKLHRIVIDASGRAYSNGQRNWIHSQLEALLPAHLEFDIVWEGFSFDVMDNKKLTFDSMDAKSFTWSEIDIYKEM